METKNKNFELLEVQRPEIKRLQKQSVKSIENLNNYTLSKCFLIVFSKKQKMTLDFDIFQFFLTNSLLSEFNPRKVFMSDFSINHFLAQVTSDVLELKEARHSHYFEILAEQKIFRGKQIRKWQKMYCQIWKWQENIKIPQSLNTTNKTANMNSAYCSIKGW